MQRLLIVEPDTALRDDLTRIAQEAGHAASATASLAAQTGNTKQLSMITVS